MLCRTVLKSTLVVSTCTILARPTPPTTPFSWTDGELRWCGVNLAILLLLNFNRLTCSYVEWNWLLDWSQFLGNILGRAWILSYCSRWELQSWHGLLGSPRGSWVLDYWKLLLIHNFSLWLSPLWCKLVIFFHQFRYLQFSLWSVHWCCLCHAIRK